MQQIQRGAVVDGEAGYVDLRLTEHDALGKLAAAVGRSRRDDGIALGRSRNHVAFGVNRCDRRIRAAPDNFVECCVGRLHSCR